MTSPAPAALLLAALATAACAAPPRPAAAASVRVFKTTGSKQCGGGGATLPVLARQLADAGIAVLASACGTDGRMYPAVCGAADGRIAIFDVAAADAAAAAALGFNALSKSPDARSMPCP